MMKNKTDTIKLPTLSAVALFEHEIKGQLSDGMWENTAPFYHWQFWCGLDVVHAPGHSLVETDQPWRCKKTSYNIAALYEHVGDRMLAIGRMARAAEVLGMKAVPDAAEYMPPTMKEWQACHASGVWQYDFVAVHMKGVTPELAAAFYAASYSMKDLRADVAAIKAAMKTVHR